MRNLFIKSVIGVTLAVSMVSCGDKWLETDYHNGIDIDTALDNAANVGLALNGTYYQLQTYYFAGNYSTTLADIASDIVYWTGNNNHQNNLYQFQYNENDNTLYYVWDYGYKVVDNAARIVNACDRLLGDASGDEAIDLRLYEAEARCLRAYASLMLVNTFAHQYMVAGTSYGSEPGIVIVDDPIEAYAEVQRASVAETYSFIVSDLTSAISLFNQIGGDRGSVNYFNEAAAYGLLARTYMYMESWSNAASAAQNAINASGITSLAYSVDGYTALYDGGDSNWESFFTLGIDGLTNWSANSCGTLFSTYGYSLSPYLTSLYGEDDCRRPLMTAFDSGELSYADDYVGGKFWYGGGNKAIATNYLINAPEMFLIQAEAYANLGQAAQAADALLVVAKRNNAITSTADLPSSADGILSFLQEERARELFQEGFRLWDLRRWNVKANLYAVFAPDIDWMYTNVDAAAIVMPIPADEINAGFGVTQNTGWQSTLPR